MAMPALPISMESSSEISEVLLRVDRPVHHVAHCMERPREFMAGGLGLSKNPLSSGLIAVEEWANQLSHQAWYSG